jgi:hypothetical protein
MKQMSRARCHMAVDVVTYINDLTTSQMQFS